MEYIIGVIIVLVIIYIYYYNKGEKLKNQIIEASSGIDVALAKRYDLITNLVSTVKGYMKHEKDVFETVTKQRTNAITGSNRLSVIEEMDSTQSKYIILAEAYPELKSSGNFLQLQKSLNDVEEHLQAARRLYNRSTTQYNTLLSQFPYVIFNGFIKNEPRQLFEAEESQKSSVEINFED